MSLFFKKLLQLAVLSAVSLTAFTVTAGVVNTKHNLAHWSPYAYRATTESRVCIFCHTPHNANPAGPLWSHKLSEATTFKKYSSGTLRMLVDSDTRTASGYVSSGDASTITGATKLCLGCHDGLTALGAITAGGVGITIAMEVETLGGSSSGYNDGAGIVNIQNKHPVSFTYNADVVTKLNTNSGPDYKGVVYGLPGGITGGTSVNSAVQDVIDNAGARVECTICHDPHVNNATNNRENLPFWISGAYDAGGSFGNVSSEEGVCLSCHSQNYGEYTGFDDYTALR